MHVLYVGGNEPCDGLLCVGAAGLCAGVVRVARDIISRLLAPRRLARAGAAAGAVTATGLY